MAWQTDRKLWAKLKPAARVFRRNPTEAEAFLWRRLQKNQVAGFKFRRQHALDRFVVDFLCPKAKLTVEVDGPVHEGRAYEDKVRDGHLRAMGYSILRFKNEDVMNDRDSVVAAIERAIAARN